MMPAIERPVKIKILPAEVTLGILGIDKPIIGFARRGNACPIKLKIVNKTDCEVTAEIPEAAADMGPGMYDISVYEGCELCDTKTVELCADCKITSIEIKEAELKNEKSPKKC